MTGSSAAPLATAAATTWSNSRANPICWASVDTPRSRARRPMATCQPLPSPPTTSVALAPSRKTSLNSLVPVNCRIGRTSIRPG